MEPGTDVIETNLVPARTPGQKVMDVAPSIAIATMLAILAMILIRKFISFEPGEAELVYSGLLAFFNTAYVYIKQNLDLRSKGL